MKLILSIFTLWLLFSTTHGQDLELNASSLRIERPELYDERELDLRLELTIGDRGYSSPNSTCS